MNYGLYLSASGATTAMYRMDVYANNLSNIETIGFKPDLPVTRQRDAERVERGDMSLPSNTLLEKLGGGVALASNRVSRAQGSLDRTGGPLDVAIRGDGYLVLRDIEPDGAESTKLTRDGRLTFNKNHQLVQASSGRPVLDTAGRPIELSRSDRVSIDEDGTISQAGQKVARIQLATVNDPTRLRKQGEGMLVVSGADSTLKPASGAIVQEHLEHSSVDPVKAMVDFGQAERAVASGTRMMQIHDEVMQRAISTFGRVG